MIRQYWLQIYLFCYFHQWNFHGNARMETVRIDLSFLTEVRFRVCSLDVFNCFSRICCALSQILCFPCTHTTLRIIETYLILIILFVMKRNSILESQLYELIVATTIFFDFPQVFPQKSFSNQKKAWIVFAIPMKALWTICEIFFCNLKCLIHIFRD